MRQALTLTPPSSVGHSTAVQIDTVLSKLHGVKRTGDSWQALCPAHEDRQASLSIAEKDGKILLHCHANCRPDDVVKALGLQMRDLFQIDTRICEQLVSAGIDRLRVAVTDIGVTEEVNLHSAIAHAIVRDFGYEKQYFIPRRFFHPVTATVETELGGK